MSSVAGAKVEKEVAMNVRSALSVWIGCAAVALSGCRQESPPPQTPTAASPVAPASSTVAPPQGAPAPSTVAAADAGAAPTQSAAKAPLDAARIASATGGKPETSDTVVKVSFPRDDIKVDIDGWSPVPPFMGLTSYAAFVPGEKPGVEAMVMGDTVLLEDEVNPAISAALESGLQVTALHNHFFFDKPHVFFMHIGGEGGAEDLAKGVKAVLDAVKAVRGKAKQPAAAFGAALPKGPSRIDAAKLDAVLGVKGQAKDGMYKAVMGRKTHAACGCTIGKAMGVNTWAAFAGTDDNAVVDGDFAVAEGELQSVLKSLRSSGINVVAIHSHMTDESPRVLFVHYWGRGKAVDLGTAVKKALDLTAWDGRSPSTT
jgi:hypothetical protein